MCRASGLRTEEETRHDDETMAHAGRRDDAGRGGAGGLRGGRQRPGHGEPDGQSQRPRGRIGYVVFYNLPYYSQHPLEALKIWTGGMSFHGGTLGVVLAMFAFTQIRKISFLRLGDMLVCAVPIGLFFGRLANFVNGELYGRPTNV